MFQNKSMETLVGLFVAAGLVALFVLAMKVSNFSAFANAEGYLVEARFDNIGGLKVRSPVTMAGVRVGRVEGISFDNETYEAVVKLKIEHKYDTLPTDSSASIFTAGLLGEQYVAVEPGGEYEYMKEDDRFKITQSALVLEEMIGQFLFKTAEGGEE